MDGFAQQLVSLRHGLMRSARSRLRNAAWAEDAVSETLLAALESRPALADPARLGAWLHGVLRHKVVDQIRRHVGDDIVVAVGDLQDLAQLQDRLPVPVAGGPPHQAADAQFIRALDSRLHQMPVRQARAFVLRECEGASTDEICAELGMTPGCLGVTLHRARQSLRDHLADHGPRGPDSGGARRRRHGLDSTRGGGGPDTGETPVAASTVPRPGDAARGRALHTAVSRAERGGLTADPSMSVGG